MERVEASTHKGVDPGALVRQSSFLPGPYMTVKEAAAWTGLHPVTIRKMARSGSLDAAKFGTGRNARWRIPMSRLVPSEPYAHLLMVGIGRRRLTDRLAALARKSGSEVSDGEFREAGDLFAEWYRLAMDPKPEGSGHDH